MVVGVHSDLIITRESVHEAEDPVASSGVHYEVDLGQGKAIFRASPVNIGKVNADLMFSISKNPHASMTEVLSKAEKYINNEEALMSKWGSSSAQKEKSKDEKKRDQSPRR